MSKRPLSVTIISVLYIVAGVVGLAYHATDLKLADSNAVLVCFVRLLAIVGGIFALRGQNWARWLLILWMAYHVVLSAFHSVGQTIAHTIFLVLIAWFLLTPKASAFFRQPEKASVDH